MVEVARLPHAGQGQQQQIGIGLLHGANRDFQLCPMDGVAGLEPHDPAPPQFFIGLPHLGRRHTQLPEIKVDRQA